jgi:indole-3-glycerol phosphate synthase
MGATLAQIVSEARLRVERARREVPLAKLAAQAEQVTAASFGRVSGFREALETRAETGIAVIAELKRASPSRGVIRGTFHVSRLAQLLKGGGAVALSVLTEEEHFQGSLGYLAEAAAATGLPCLRKDFLVDEYQLFEAKLHGAAAVLLIAAALTGPELGTLHSRARELGLDVLCEVHDEAELARAVAIGADIIGVNSRNLKTLEVDRATHFALAAQIPKNVLRVAESGIKTGRDVRELWSAGYRAFLVGETLMTENDPGAALAQLIAQAKAPRAGAPAPSSWPQGTKD